jgi:hypothetical protein
MASLKEFSQSGDARNVLMAFADAYDEAAPDDEIAITTGHDLTGALAVVILVGPQPFAFTLPQALLMAASLDRERSANLTKLATGIRHVIRSLEGPKP